MKQSNKTKYSQRRRTLLKAGSYGMALGAMQASGFSPLLSNAGAATGANGSNKILVVFELSGGNDGLNTLVPYSDDAYYRLRPNLGIRENKVRKIDENFGFNPDRLRTAIFLALHVDGVLAYSCSQQR
jgi:uncharacterized protein (DUF1501 family)